MDNDTKQLIDETIAKFVKEQSKPIEIKVRDDKYEVCPHCKSEILEKHEFTEDGGKTWRHSDCKGLIERPDNTDTIPEWLSPIVKELKGIDESNVIDGHLPISGEEKYYKQEKGGEMAAVNLEEINNGETHEVIVVNSMDTSKMFDGQIRPINMSNIPLKFNITRISRDGADAFLIRVQNG